MVLEDFLPYHLDEALGVFLIMVFGETLVLWLGCCGGNSGMAAWRPPVPQHLHAVRDRTSGHHTQSCTSVVSRLMHPLLLVPCCCVAAPAAVAAAVGCDVRAPQLPHTMLDASVVEASTSLPVFK